MTPRLPYVGGAQEVPIVGKSRGAISNRWMIVARGLVLAMSQLALQERAEAANATYNAAASTTWLTSGNWSPAAYPGATGSSANTDIASFANVPSGSLTIGINMNTAGGNFSVGAISNSPARAAALNIGNNAGTAAGTLRLNGATVNGVANVILRNAGSAAVTIQAKQGSGLAMGLALGNNTDNRIYVDSSSDITIQSIITSVSGTTPLTIAGSGSGIAHITNTANTFTGTITFLGAETRFNGPGSFGNVNNTLVIDGGRMATLSGSTYTLASTHGIQVSDAAGNSISVVTSGTLTYDGVMADKPSTAGAWAKQGAGTLALGGASTYTGDTAINNGTL
jgi:autotransporter-associated beta strand protein